MILLFVWLAIIIAIAYIVKNKIVFRVDTFFRKGFTKHDDKYGVYCFCGKQGDGKTYSVIDTLDSQSKGKIVITNVKSYYDSHKENSIYETDFGKIYEMLRDLEDCSKYIIFYDEIFTLIEKGKLSKEMLAFISQMRKRHLYLYTTAQEWLEINVTFRRYVRYQVQCKMRNLRLLNFAISINEINDAYQMKWDNLENEYVCPRIKTTIKKCSKAIADSYDTFEVIKTSGNLLARTGRQ